MAVPALTANSPAGGSIAWAAFNINYNGQAYAIPAGNTAAMFVWWPYNGGAGGALQASNVQPVLSDDDLLLFINKGGIPVNVQFASLLDGDLLVNGTVAAAALIAGTISAREIGVDAVTANAIIAGAIGTSELAAGAVTAATIAAGAITADKLSIGTVSDSAVVNPSFEDTNAGLPVGWTFSATGAANVTLNTPSPITGTNAIGLNVTGAGGNAQADQAVGSRIPVRAGDTWALSVTAVASAAVASGLAITAVFFDGTGAQVGTVQALGTGVGVTSASFIGQAIAPANAKTMGVRVNYNGAVANVTIDDVNAYKIILSARIADGSISTPKLAAGAVTAGTIAAGTITATQIAAGAITATQIATDAVTANAILAGAITTAKIAAGAITATQIAAGAIDATKLTATAIDGKTINGATITAGTFSTGTPTLSSDSRVQIQANGQSIQFIGLGHTLAHIDGGTDASGDGTLTFALDWFDAPASISMDGKTGIVTYTGGDDGTGLTGWSHKFNGGPIHFSDKVLRNIGQITNSSPVNLLQDGTLHRILVLQAIAGTASNALVYLSSAGATLAQISTTGNVQGTGAYTNLSDKAVKRNIRYLDRESHGLAVVRALKPASFAYEWMPEETHHGFIAQDVRDVLPDAVSLFNTKPDASELDRYDPGSPERAALQERHDAQMAQPDLLGLRTDAIVAALVLAVQDLDRRVSR